MTPSERQALMIIARGRLDCGRPLGGAKAQAVARAALTEAGADWTREGNRQAMIAGIHHRKTDA